MIKCNLCGNDFPERIKINKKLRNLRNRKYCLKCSPFGFHNTRKLNKKIRNKPDKLNEKSVHDGKKIICKCCGRHYIYLKTKGHSLKICNSCVVYSSRGKLKKRAVEYKGGKCTLCKYDKCIASLCFHHIDPSKKDFTISHSYGFGWARIKEEIDKCILLCNNCHCELHYNEKLDIKLSHDKKIYKCELCDKIISRGAKKCERCYYKSITKIDWPRTEIIIKMISSSSYLQVAKKLGVSDNAVRKRIKNHARIV